MLESIVRNFLYYPVKMARNEPVPPYVRGAEEVWIQTASGHEVHGLYWPAADSRPTVLFFHGNAQSVFEWALIRDELEPMACGLLLVDYPGYGKSGGQPSESALYTCGEASWQYLVESRGVCADRIVVFGKSLGGGVGSKLAAERPILGLVLESTFTSVPAVARRLFPFLPVGMIMKTETYDTASRLREITAPILVVHGTNDELIPVAQGKALFEGANEPKQLYLVDGAGHNDVCLVARGRYGQTLRKWLDGVAGDPIRPTKEKQ